MPLAIAKVPVPIAPLVSAPGEPVVFLPKMSVPSFKLNPLVNVLAPVSAKEPFPDLEMAPPALVIGAEMIKPIGDRPETLITGAALESCRADKAGFVAP